MNNERYPVSVDRTMMIFEFISEGIRGNISKLVVYSKTRQHNLYNLGFGDRNATTGDVDDEVISNNGDSKKVLATVASTLYNFLNEHPDATVFATGSTKARTRLYRIGISNSIEEIEKDFKVYGLSENGWQPFEKHIEYQAFLISKKKG